MGGTWTGEKGNCPICGRYRILVIDHDHRSGAVRGRICQGCNSKIGWMMVSGEAARKYLADPPGVPGFTTYKQYRVHYHHENHKKRRSMAT